MKSFLGLAAALFLPVLVNAAIPPSNSTNVNVQVAPRGQLVFNPPNSVAPVGTIVTCYFSKSSIVHSATQGSLEKPCVPLDGGFDSDLQSSGATFSVQVKNDTQPIFWFSKAKDDCIQGMIGAVNASPDQYDAYVAAAKALGSNGKTSSSSSKSASSSPPASKPSAPPSSSPPVSKPPSSSSSKAPNTTTTTH